MGLSLNQLSADTLSDIINSTFTGVQTGSCLIVSGQTTATDGLGGFYFYDDTSTATADGYTIIKQNVLGPTDPGRWFRRENIRQIPANYTQGTTSAIDYVSNKPIIPAAQVNSDWNSVSGLSQILNKPPVPSVTRTTSTLSLSLVGTGATGTQISSAKDSTVRATVQTSATATIAGAATSTVTLKKCITNSSTEGDWTTVSVSETSQSYSLAVALQGVTGGKAQLVTDLPAGWFVKLVNTGSGTHTETFIFGEKTVYG